MPQAGSCGSSLRSSTKLCPIITTSSSNTARTIIPGISSLLHCFSRLLRKRARRRPRPGITQDGSGTTSSPTSSERLVQDAVTTSSCPPRSDTETNQSVILESEQRRQGCRESWYVFSLRYCSLNAAKTNSWLGKIYSISGFVISLESARRASSAPTNSPSQTRHCR